MTNILVKWPDGMPGWIQDAVDRGCLMQTVIAKVEQLEKDLETAKEALEKLAKLGNGDKYGNSIGNAIAQQALLDIIASEDI